MNNQENKKELTDQEKVEGVVGMVQLVFGIVMIVLGMGLLR